MKKVPLNLTNPPLTINMSTPPLSKPISSVISVISSNVPKVANVNPPRVPVSILTQHQVKQKIVKTIEKPMMLALSNSKLSSLSVTHDATLPAKIFQDDAASPDSTVSSENNPEKDLNTNPMTSTSQQLTSLTAQGSSPMDQRPGIFKEPTKDIDIESEISQQTELPHTLCLSDRTPLLLGKADIKSPDPIPEKIPDNIMEGDDEDKPEDNIQTNLLLSYNKSISEPPPPPPMSESKPEESVVKTIKAIANQTKEMVIDSNMQITSDMAQDSVQISIPSPTPSQERYLNDITMQEHHETAESTKHVETFEDMLHILENIGDETKTYGMKQQNPKPGNQSMQNPNISTPKPEQKESQESSGFTKREPERLALQSATVPQLSPLSQPAELTSNMVNVSQQIRTIMSSLNPNTPKIDTQPVTRKNSDATTPTQVNFENLLPSSKVEVAASRPSPIQRIDSKPITSIPSSESLPMSAAQAIGSRVNTLSSMGQMRKSPTVSPINSPVGLQNSLMKSPAQMISNQSFSPMDDTGPTSVASQIIQMPALSKIHSSTATATMIHSNNTITTSMSGFQKNQSSLPTSILGHTLLQPTRQINTSNLPFNQQSISSSQPPALVMTSRPMMGNKEPAPNVTVRTHSIVSSGINQIPAKPAPPGSINFITSSKLLHTQLTSPLKRSKSTDEPKSEVIVGHIQPTKRHSVEAVVVKSEPMETDEPSTSTTTTTDAGSKHNVQQTTANQKNDESQNVLLKQLLQTTTTAATVVPQRTLTIQRTAPALGTIPSLEAQLARPSIPPPTLSLTPEVEIPKNSPRHNIMTSNVVNSPFTTRPIQTIPTSAISPMTQTSTQSLMDVRKPPIKMMSKEETTPIPESSPTMKSMQMYPMSIENQQLQQAIKKEIAPPQQSPVHRPFTPMDVKKELLDESSQQSATSGVSTASDQGKLDQPMKEEFTENVNMDVSSEANAPETPSEAKKRKRREYQQKKRKQLQMNMKAAAENNLSAANAKKRPRKGSRYEEDYDTFIDNLMTQLRLLPAMQIQEPALTTNFAVCPLFGSGDLTKLKNKDYDLLKGDLVGEFGNAKIPNVGDYYNTKPFGEEEPLPEKPPASTQRGFYDQEFQPILFDDDPEDKKLDFICKERDTDTPDSIVSCSSPECLETEPPNRFPGLKLIDDEEEDEDSDSASGRISPVIPIIAPVPIRVKPVSLYQSKDDEENSKALKTLDTDAAKVKGGDSPGSTETNENVTVTLTLTSGAAEDILGVLKELAGILHIPPPTSYQIIERTATPPSHKLGLYRSKGKDGKEGTPIDIQSILNGAAKFCRHCDVVILDSVVRAKASEFPLLSANKGNAEEILCDSDSELYFCSTQCYESFAWRPTNIILDGKAKTAVKEDTKSEVDTNLSKDRDDFDTASTESMETDDLDIKPDIKDEKMDLSFMDSLDNDELMKEVGDDVSALDEDLKSEQDDKSNQSTAEREKYRGVRYKAWSPGCIGPPVKYKRPTDRELTELVFRTGVAIMPVTNEDTRRCELCGIQGDGVADGVSRLLNCDVNRWVHLNCALWSEGVYETVSGALMNVETALGAGSNATCAVCRRLGATVRCFKVRCGSVYHLGCAVKDNCVFYKNKTAFCASHAPKNEKDNELTTLSVQRRVYISRDEQRQVASVMLHSDTNHLIRVGGLIFLSPGHLLPHQLAAFHTPNYIYPIGYKIVRFYWSMSRANCRCRYLCWISEEAGRPRFHVRAQDEPRNECAAATPRAAWANVLDAVAALREGRTEDGVLKLWPNYVTGEDLFGLTEPAVVRVLESLPGIETLTDYRFKFGRSALLEGGLAVNPTGCARSEARARAAWRRPTRSLLPAAPAPPPAADHPACPYSKQFVHTKSSQYKKMKSEWRNNVYLARSKIQGLGLYAARDLEKHTMVIEYIGEIIRSELSEIREKQYEAKNRGIYMFRLDERRVVDATLSGGLARYINHSCQPNCVAETVEVDRHLRIIIFAKRRIARGEELAYDYKFDIEDDAHKIMCMCGAPNCRKWMN
uniref:Histone-lysine N-methyltransferase n=1 Tax=Heliothis virescens TaxID=7102 RepID=A0A2A4J0G2_HELVI